ncbi:hypothetical protein ACSMDF_13600 [Yersinia enterocolitica]|uniref:hypothetical protein n=1 Tax=Yersinia TaxID=629 RepID=UPI0002D59C71|nr:MULTISPECIES: hypothetical protein [Yersinia]CNH89505.1 Uncharacterised protein [Yersinia massiliensis]CNJ94710.1 Uncharacterised protein [Yersinia frederiksenii]
MKIEKVDPSRFEEWEFDLIDDGGVEVAFQLRPEPVYFVMRHGRRKKCFSRETAINRLAHFMTEKVFKRAGVKSRVGETYTTLEDGRIAHNRGEHTIDYIIAHSRCMRRIRRLLAKRREILRQEAKKKKQTDSLIDKYKKAIDKVAELKKEIVSLNY